MYAALVNPLVAGIVGALSGVALLWLSRISFKLVTPVNPGAGLALVVLAMLGRAALAIGLLLAVRTWAHSVLVPFALGLAGGFLVSYTIELVRYSGVRAQARQRTS